MKLEFQFIDHFLESLPGPQVNVKLQERKEINTFKVIV